MVTCSFTCVKFQIFVQKGDKKADFVFITVKFLSTLSALRPLI